MSNKDQAKLKGLPCSVTGRLYKMLKEREAFGDLIVVTLPERRQRVHQYHEHSVTCMEGRNKASKIRTKKENEFS